MKIRKSLCLLFIQPSGHFGFLQQTCCKKLCNNQTELKNLYVCYLFNLVDILDFYNKLVLRGAVLGMLTSL